MGRTEQIRSQESRQGWTRPTASRQAWLSQAESKLPERRGNPPPEAHSRGAVKENRPFRREDVPLASWGTPETHRPPYTRPNSRSARKGQRREARKEQKYTAQRLATPATRSKQQRPGTKCSHAPWKGSGSGQWAADLAPAMSLGETRTVPRTNQASLGPWSSDASLSNATIVPRAPRSAPSSQPISPSPRKARHNRILQLATPTAREDADSGSTDNRRSGLDAASHRRWLRRLATPTRPEGQRPVAVPHGRPAAHNSNTALTGQAYICTWQHVPGSQLTAKSPYAGKDAVCPRFQVGGSHHSYAKPPPPPPGCDRLPPPEPPRLPTVEDFPSLYVPAVAKPTTPQLRHPPLAPREPEILQPPNLAPEPPDLRQPKKPPDDAELLVSSVASVDVSKIAPVQAYARSVQQIVAAKEHCLLEIDLAVEEVLKNHEDGLARWDGVAMGLLKSLEARHMQALALAASGRDVMQTGWTAEESASWKSWIEEHLEYKTVMKKKDLSLEKHEKWLHLVTTVAKATTSVCTATDRAEQSICATVRQTQLLEPDLVAHMNISARSCESSSLRNDAQQVLMQTWQFLDKLEREQMTALDSANSALCAYDPEHVAKKSPKVSTVFGPSTGAVTIPGEAWSEEETAQWNQWAADLIEHQLQKLAQTLLCEDLEACADLLTQVRSASGDCHIKMTNSFWAQQEEIWRLASHWKPASFENLDKDFDPAAGLRACENRDIVALRAAWEHNRARWLPFYQEMDRLTATGHNFELPVDTQREQEQVDHFVEVYQCEVRRSQQVLQGLQGTQWLYTRAFSDTRHYSNKLLVLCRRPGEGAVFGYHCKYRGGGSSKKDLAARCNAGSSFIGRRFR